MKKSIYTIILLTMFFAGCQNDETVTPKELKLDYYIDSYNLDALGFIPQLKVTYAYDKAGKVSKITFFGYNPNSGSFEELRHLDFLYTNGQVNKITGYLTGDKDYYIEDSYQYSSDLHVSKISENNIAVGVTSEANFTYHPADSSVLVAYTYSNGASFEYEYYYNNHNIVSDKTTRGSELCNDGAYTYDQNKNPFKDLGYIDYNLTNLSVNNKLTEDVNYVGCAFPSLVPESYTYEYNELGYPTKATTTYKSQSGAKSQKTFFYK
jgi:hypothetical protein